MITAFDHVAITVKDLDATIAWYEEHLGFSVKRMRENQERGIRIAFLGVGEHAMLEFFGFLDPSKGVDGPTLTREETGIKHISFFVDELESIHRRLESAGIEFTTVTPSRVVFKDLNDIILELRLSTG